METIVKTLAEQHAKFGLHHAKRCDPAPFMRDLLAILFPHFRGSDPVQASELQKLENSIAAMITALRVQAVPKDLGGILQCLPAIQATLLLDAHAILKEDPAAQSLDEIIICYPGFFAIAAYRVAHEFYRRKIVILPRLLTEYSHQCTGIDIHPGAEIGAGFCIDHGTGIVIGETSIVGEHVKLYQGVTLGGVSVKKGEANKKRHPTVQDNVVIYSNATVLGGETVIGHDSIVGGNVWITESVPPHSVIYHKAEVSLRNTKIGK